MANALDDGHAYLRTGTDSSQISPAERPAGTRKANSLMEAGAMEAVLPSLGSLCFTLFFLSLSPVIMSILLGSYSSGQLNVPCSHNGYAYSSDIPAIGKELVRSFHQTIANIYRTKVPFVGEGVVPPAARSDTTTNSRPTTEQTSLNDRRRGTLVHTRRFHADYYPG